MPVASSRFSFLLKLVAALLLVAVADSVVELPKFGSWLGGLCLLWALVALLVRPALRRGTPAVAIGAACGLALILAYDPGPLAWLMFWASLSIAALLPRTAGFDDALRWMARLAVHGATGPFAPLVDLGRLSRSRPKAGRRGLRSAAALLALPLATSALFLALFASANPLIGRAFADVRLPSVGQVAFWIAILMLVWPSLRPRVLTTRLVGMLPSPEVSLPGSSTASVLISLALFNALFAVQNLLDLAFLWSGAPLPEGVTLADYAHRGAYPLIVTALLAGLFVLTTMKPGSATAANPAIRRLVVAWIAQNLLLVASSILRTCDYIAVYMLTPLRIAALAWMVLVAFGLILICWRMLAARSARWLINCNAAAAALVLLASTLFDFQSIAAAWNVRHAREAGGSAVALDLCELHGAASSSLISLIELESKPLPPAFRDRLLRVREDNLLTVEMMQSDWRTWTWHNHRRLAAARRLLGSAPAVSQPLPAGATLSCDGSIRFPASPLPPPAR